MSEQINIYEAKTQLSKLVERAEAGEEIIIARGGRPAAKLVPFRSRAVKRKPGRMRGRIRLGRDFDAPLPPNLFEGDWRLLLDTHILLWWVMGDRRLPR